MIDLIRDWAVWVAALIAVVLTIRATVRFDLNEWLKDRHKQKREQLRFLCPHVVVSQQNGQPVVRSTFISPPGTVAWQCQRCGLITHDDAWVEEHTAYWANNPNELFKRIRKIEKLTNKFMHF